MAPPPPPAAGHRPGPTNVVVLSKIPEGVSEQQIAAGSGRYSEVLQVSFRASDPDGPGWAIIAFASPELAKAARERLDGKALAGSVAGAAPLEAVLGEGLFGNLRALSEQESPWKEARTPQGQVYYFHSVTRQTTWVKPPPEFSPMPPPPPTASLGGGRVVPAPTGMPHMLSGGRGPAPAPVAPAPLFSPPPVQGQAAFQAAQAAVNAAMVPAGSAAANINAGPVGANLFIYHIPNSWDDSILRQHFEHFGKIVSCRVQTDNEGRPRGFGFVSFDTAGGAQAAIAGMHGFPVEGKHLKVQLKKGDEQQMIPGGAPLGASGPVGGLLDIQPPPPPGLPPQAFGAPGGALGLGGAPGLGFGAARPQVMAPLRPCPY